ncbi:MAG: hypothetical protein U9R77_05745 [Pseudomonadota bacterium]|uniref:hypothetical protein n=1 Tax=Sphingobium naphthae TaxID=1886786 RepID=UPI002B14D337|nr:hypothetical protein [Pseudomonadota bacterium]
MIIRAAALVAMMMLAAQSAGAQQESEAANGAPYRASSQARNSADRLGTESSTRDMLPPADRAQAVAMMQRFAQCVVAGDPTTARQLLALAPASSEEQALLNAIAKRRANCLQQGKLRMKGNWMRGAIAEQLYLRAYPKPIEAAATPNAPLTARADAQKWPYQAYADCIVARNAPAADAMLRAEPGSAAEKSALQQTMPTLSSCLAGGKDSKLAIDRTMLRGYLAESLYAQRSPAG